MRRRPTGAVVLVAGVLVVSAGGCGLFSGARHPGGTATERGLASWYHLPGNTTASGEKYRASGMTAAHRTLPFGAEVLVRRLDNGKTVKVRINDRGPFIKGRIIDLNRASARQLDMIEAGLVPVEIRVTKWP